MTRVAAIAFALIVSGCGAHGSATRPTASESLLSVRIWQDETTYFNELMRYFGVRYQASGYITGISELRLLAVAALNTNVVHEFAHAVSLAVNPQFGTNPRWFWEGRRGFLRLIQTSGDLPAALGVSPPEFEAAWQSYVRRQYLS
jgi:hypothetical protein